jgi:hypothetical protein
MKADFLGSIMGKPARARLLRAFIFNQNQHFTLAQIAKRSGVTPGVAEDEVALFESWGLLAKSKIIIPQKPEAEEKKPKRKVIKKKGKKVTIKEKPKKTHENIWTLDTDFAHLRALVAFVREISPMEYDEVVTAIQKSGKIATIILSGAFMGDATRPVDIVVAADVLNERRLETAIHSLEPFFGHEIRYAAFSTPEFRYRLSVHDRLIRDTLDYPHLILLDKNKMF